MTIRFHPKQNCFMKDFAALDSRSAHAHLRGQSRRARAYVLFDSISRVLGRSDRTAGDYRRLSRWLFVHRQRLTSWAQAILSAGTAVAGLAAGIAIYLASQA